MVKKADIPKGYKQTEVGVIPEDWAVKALAEIGEVIRGASPRPKGDKRFYGGDIPRLMVEDVTRDGKFVFPRVDFLTEEGAKRSRPCRKGTLTIVCSGTVGIVSFLGVNACIHDGFLGLVKISKDISDDYLYHQLNILRTSFDSAATHGGVFTNLTTTGVKEFKVPLPPTKKEQQAIAEALSDVDGLIGSLDALISKKRQIKQGTMRQLLTGKKRLPGFSGEWEEKELGELGTFKKGRNIPKKELRTEGFPCVLYGEIYTRYDNVSETLESYIPQEIAINSTTIKSGDILFAGSGETAEEIGKCFSYIGKEDAYAGGDLIVFTPYESNSIFLGYLLNSAEINTQKAKMGQGSSVVHIYTSSLKKIVLKSPDRKEQEAIAQVIINMDTEIEALEQKQDKYKTIKQAMMQELLTGRIRLV